VEDHTLVSVIINNYNYGKFLVDAIESALNQTYRNIEIIVVDDGSTDNSREIIASYDGKLLTILKENGGQPSSYNVGFAASKGEIICFLDSDDIFLPDKVEKIVKIFTSYKEIEWCFHSLLLIDKDCNPLNFTTTRNYVTRECDLRQRIQSGRLPPSLPSSSALCFRRSLLKQILPMPTSTNMLASDFYVKYMAVGLSKGFILAEKLTHQRIHGNNVATLQNSKKYLQAREQLFTSHWIRQEFPQFNKLANKTYAIGIVINRKSCEQDYDNNSLITSYFKLLSRNEKIFIKFLLTYYFFKDLKEVFINALFYRKPNYG
jgi:glycosyltransferase involved in cell wall biosynthesis